MMLCQVCLVHVLRYSEEAVVYMYMLYSVSVCVLG